MIATQETPGRIALARKLRAKGMSRKAIARLMGMADKAVPETDSSEPRKTQRSIRFSEVSAYRCPTCGRLVTVAPCVACASNTPTATRKADRAAAVSAARNRAAIAEALASDRPPALILPPGPQEFQPLDPHELFPWIRQRKPNRRKPRPAKEGRHEPREQGSPREPG